MLIDSQVVFPIIVTFEDGSRDEYNDIAEIECNLEDFDSEQETRCYVVDQMGQELNLRVKLLSLKEISVVKKGAVNESKSSK